MATLFKENGETLEVTPKNGEAFDVEELQTMVSGLVEIIHCTDGRLLVTDEEGKFKPHYKKNKKATEILHRLTLCHPLDYVVGNALLCEDEEID